MQTANQKVKVNTSVITDAGADVTTTTTTESCNDDNYRNKHGDYD